MRIILFQLISNVNNKLFVLVTLNIIFEHFCSAQLLQLKCSAKLDLVVSKLSFIMCSSSNVQVLSSKGHRGSESEKHPSVWTSGVCAVFCNRCRSPVWLIEVYVEHKCPVGKDTFLSNETMVAAVPALLVREIHFTFIWPRRLVVVIWHWRLEVRRPEKNSHMCNWNCHKPPKYKGLNESTVYTTVIQQHYDEYGKEILTCRTQEKSFHRRRFCHKSPQRSPLWTNPCWAMNWTFFWITQERKSTSM